MEEKNELKKQLYLTQLKACLKRIDERNAKIDDITKELGVDLSGKKRR